MSKTDKSVADYFDLGGNLNEEACEFEGVDIKDFVDKRSSVKPTFCGRNGLVTHFDLKNDSEVVFYRHPNIVYADILFSGGVRTILFKCRQKKNLTRFITRVLELASAGPDRVHPDFRI